MEKMRQNSGNPIKDMSASKRDSKYFAVQNYDKIFLAGISINKLQNHYDFSLKILSLFCLF